MRTRVKKFANWRGKKPFVEMETLRHRLNAKLLIGLGVLSVAAMPVTASLRNEQRASVENPVTQPAVKETPKHELAPLKEPKERQLPSSTSSRKQTNVTVETTQESSKTRPKTEVKLNGDSVAVPQSGIVHKVVHDKNGTTTFTLQSKNHSSGTTETSSTTEVQVRTEGSAASDGLP